MKSESEQAARRQRHQRHQQEVSHSVEVKRREDHHGNGQRQWEAGRQWEEFTEKKSSGSVVKSRDGEELLAPSDTCC